MKLGSLGRGLGVTAVFLALTYVYFYPGSRLMFERSTTWVMSEDTDPSVLPQVYDSLERLFARDWTELLYGTVALETGNPDHPTASWISVNERWIVMGLSPFLPVEQLSTGLVVVLTLLNAFAFYFLAKRLGWTEPIALATAISWAFCPFTRARAKVHQAMVGTYHLPLIFLGLHILARERSKRSVLLAGACFLLASTVNAYFVIIAAALAPLYAVYLYLEWDRQGAIRVVTRTLLASSPAFFFLAWNLKMSVSPRAHIPAAEIFPATGEVAVGQRFHPFLKVSAARGLDYLTSDLDLAAQTRRIEERGKNLAPEEVTHEWFWPRRWFNEHQLARMGTALPHERSVGLRWSVIAFALAALWATRGAARRSVWFWAAFAFVSFWLSLSPDVPFVGAGLSGWLWKVFHQFRVPSRAAIGVHFGLLGMMGVFAMQLRRGDRGRWLVLGLPLLMIVDYPPLLTAMPIAPVRPASTHLVRDGVCATGTLFPPSFGPGFEEVQYYHFKQRLRGTPCAFIQALTDPVSVKDLAERFPPSPKTLEELVASPAARDKLVEFVRCLDLGWIAFDEKTPGATREDLCAKLGWTLNDDSTCVAKVAKSPTSRRPADCPR